MEDQAHQTIQIRRATPADAAILAELINVASEGFAEVVWRTLATPRESAWQVGRRRMADRAASSGFECWLIDEADRPVAGLTGYPAGARPGTGPTPELIRPLAELEALAPGSWYINVITTLPDRRGRGLGRHLLDLAGNRARAAGLDRLSIIVADGSDDAIRLCRRGGFAEVARRPMLKHEWASVSRDWVLMVLPLGPAPCDV